MHHINRDSVATFVAWAEFENPLIDVYCAELVFRLAEAKRKAPPMMWLPGHNHSSAIAHIGTSEDRLGKAIVSFITKSTVASGSWTRPSTARLTFLCAVAVHAEIEELVPQFTRQHGIAVDVNYDVNPAVAKRVMAGEDFDVGLNNPWYVEEMIKRGLVIPDIHVPFGRVPLTIGAPALSRRDPPSLRRT